MKRALFAALLVAWPEVGRGEGLRLRGDAMAQAAAPLGVLRLSGDSPLSPGAAIEATVWMSGGDAISPELDALVATISYVDPGGLGSARAGRFILTSGALLPVQLDGASVRAQLVGGTNVELFGGLPVVPRFGERRFDWLLGGRLGLDLGEVAFGAAFMERRDAGQVADRELAADGQAVLGAGLELALRASVDLLLFGLSQGSVALAWDHGPLRLELSGSQRSPSRLLPATSLFTVLGDVSARVIGGRAYLRVAPRLELYGGGGARFFDADPHADLFLGGSLDLDAEGRRAIRAELRRQGAPEGGWTGARVSGYAELPLGLWISTELELVRADPSAGAEGSPWPWGLVAAHMIPIEGIEVALALEGRGTPTETRAFDLLLSISGSTGR